ncbi:MAG TPA: hypothetical protein DCS04_04355 [Ruminococcaceae bacterium]|nr:hypothetical protein [Oscillospiraceae bacterium]
MKKTFKKRAFISAIAMLIVSAIVLTSATYAWFSMAKRVEVESMELNVTSPEGIQISANTSAFTTKLTVDNIKGTDETAGGKRFNAYTGNMNNVPTTVKPSSSMFATYNSLPGWFDGSINDQKKMDIYATNEVGSGLVAFDLFIKVKNATTVKFGSSSVTCDGNDELPTAMRIALVKCGTVAENAGASDIQKLVPNQDNTKKVIYEVDATNHTAEAVSHGASGIMTTRGISTAGTNVNCDSTYPNIVVDKTAGISATVATNASAAKINVDAGITRMRVYMWMEGNDVDCANDVAGSTINFNLVLEID